MRLYLVRHADALQSPPHTLSDRGKEMCHKMRSLLKITNFQVDEVYHSPKKRAQQTAELLIPGGSLQEKPFLNPNEEPHFLLEEIDSREKNLLVVSHLPFLEACVEKMQITGIQSIDFINTAILALERRVQWELLWLLTPKIFD